MPDLRAEVRRRLGEVNVDAARKIEIVEEIAQDLEQRVEELVAGGASRAEAERRVLAELPERLARDVAAAERPTRLAPPIVGEPRGSALGDLWRDLRYGVRALVKSPAFTVVTILSLALGIGANTAIFQMIDAVHLRALPVAEPERLASVSILVDSDFRSGSFYSWHADLTNPMWERIRDRQEAFTGVFAWGDASFNLAPAGEVRRARGVFVSGGYFQVLGVPPFLGRVFTAADDRRGCGTTPGAVVSHGFWERELDASPDAIGRKIWLDGIQVEVVGVLPAGFRGLEIGRAYEVAVPICMQPTFSPGQGLLDRRNGYWLSVMGRLKPGWTVGRASAHLAALSPGIFEETVPETYDAEGANKYRHYLLGAKSAATGISSLREEYEKPLIFLLVTAGLVLLIACANLANLLLARASAREREIAVRLAIGASRGRLIRQLMTESLLLAVLGAAAGLWLAHALGDLLLRFLSTRDRPMVVELSPDWRVLGFTVGLGVLTCLLFGLAPALRASRTDIGLVLKATSGHGSTVARYGLRRLLVAAQVALSFVLLVGALLFSRSLGKLSSVDAGFNERGVVVFSVDMERMELSPEANLATQARLLERIRAVPGVVAASSAAIVPISGSGWNQGCIDASKPDGERKNAWFNRVSTDYFTTVGTPILAGRDFRPSDDRGAPVVGIVNQTVAKRYFGGENPIGKHLSAAPGPDGKPWDIEIIGLVRDSKYGELKEKDEPIVFVHHAQEPKPNPGIDFLVRAGAPLAGVVSGLKQAVNEIAPRASLDIDLMERMVRDSLLRERLLATLSGFFGLLAAILATIGLYGVVAYGVARRTHEIGIRMALGASRRSIAGMVVRETSGLLVIGLVAGLGIALAASRLAESMLFGLKPHDPLAYAIALGLMSIVTVVAAALPARRAARVDPMVALKDE